MSLLQIKVKVAAAFAAAGDAEGTDDESQEALSPTDGSSTEAPVVLCVCVPVCIPEVHCCSSVCLFVCYLLVRTSFNGRYFADKPYCYNLNN